MKKKIKIMNIAMYPLRQSVAHINIIVYHYNLNYLQKVSIMFSILYRIPELNVNTLTDNLTRKLKC